MSWKQFMCLILMLNFGHQNIPSFICQWFNKLFKHVFWKKGNFSRFPIFPGKNQFFQFPWVFSNLPGFFPTLIKIHEGKNQKWSNFFKTSSFRIKYVLSRNDRMKTKMHIINVPFNCNSQFIYSFERFFSQLFTDVVEIWNFTVFGSKC